MRQRLLLTGPDRSLAMLSSLLATSLAACCPALALPAPPDPPATLAATAPSHGGQDLEQWVAQLEAGTGEERVLAARHLRDLGKRAAKAVPALVRTLRSEDAPLVDASVEALVAVGPKARAALLEVLASGEFEGEAVPLGPVARALLQLGKRARLAVEASIEAAEPGPALFRMLVELGEPGLPFLVDAAGGDEALAPEALRSIRVLAAREVRDEAPLDRALKGVDDEDLAAAIALCWLQAPGRGDVAPMARWIESGRPALVETGLWAAGLMGDGAASLAGEALAQLEGDPTLRRTALWALGAMVTPGPGEPRDEVAASFPGASAAARRRAATAQEDDILLIWREAGGSLGLRGRVGDLARKRWALAPTWTARVEPYPAAPDPSAAPSAVTAAVARLTAAAGAWSAAPGTHVDAALASQVLSRVGVTSEEAVALWTGWLESESPDLRREALLGLRSVGRDALEHEALVIAQLSDPETRVAAAQVLAAFATPTAWTATVEAVAAIDGTPPFPMLAAIGRFDVAALRPGLDRFRELYREGHYVMAAFLIRFGDEVVDDLVGELDAGLADRRMVAAESLGHVGAPARSALPKLRSMKERSPIAQQLLVDAISRIEAGG